MLPLAPAFLHSCAKTAKKQPAASCVHFHSDGADFQRTLTSDLCDHERHYTSHLDCGRVRVLRDPCFHRASASSSQDSRSCNLLNSQQHCFRYEEKKATPEHVSQIQTVVHVSHRRCLHRTIHANILVGSVAWSVAWLSWAALRLRLSLV